MCRMCGPSASSLIEKEYKNLGIIASSTTYDNPIQILDDLLNVDKISKLYFTGGEPTANKSFLNFLQKCIELKKTDFVIATFFPHFRPVYIQTCKI